MSGTRFNKNIEYTVVCHLVGQFVHVHDIQIYLSIVQQSRCSFGCKFMVCIQLRWM